MNGLITVHFASGADGTPMFVVTTGIESIMAHPGGTSCRINLVSGRTLEVLDSADEVAAKVSEALT